jgi:hypothetical protein
VKDAENINIAICLYEIRDSVVFVEENPNLAGLFGFIPVAELRVISE